MGRLARNSFTSGPASACFRPYVRQAAFGVLWWYTLCQGISRRGNQRFPKYMPDIESRESAGTSRAPSPASSCEPRPPRTRKASRSSERRVSVTGQNTINRRLTFLFAVAGGAAVGNLYWLQPLLDLIAAERLVAAPGVSVGGRPGKGGCADGWGGDSGERDVPGPARSGAGGSRVRRRRAWPVAPVQRRGGSPSQRDGDQ
jgi:hypothetical protein